LSFVLTAVVTSWFVVRIVASFRDHDRQASEAAQRALRDEAVLRVGALAAGAAHELATPLTTMTVLAGEIANSAETPSMRRDAAALSDQVKRCRGLIGDLLAAATHAHASGGGRERLDRFLESVAAGARAMHPEATILCDWTGIVPAPEVFGELGLKQALSALLDNAVDASPNDVGFAGRVDAGTLRLSIEDRGGGVSAADLPKLGRAFFSTKPSGKGVGLGLVIATRAIERLGGTLRWESDAGRGTRAEVTLPLAALRLKHTT
jgi:two-component system, sensor histidine kinase RegB